MKRRNFIKTIPLSISLATVTSELVSQTSTNTIFQTKNTNNIMAFELPALPYAFNALEPHIDAKTMEIHHGKHHNAYVTNLNNAVAADATAQGKSLEDLIAHISKFPMAIRNNGGGHWNHSMFWSIMSPNGGGEPKGEIALAINGAFGSFENFKKEFSNAGLANSISPCKVIAIISTSCNLSFSNASARSKCSGVHALPCTKIR